MKYYPMHMHLHAAHEPTASIGSHMSHAKALGIEYLWLTEHDVRMGEKARSLPVFRFPRKELFCEMPNKVMAGFKKPEPSLAEYSFAKCEGNISLDIKVDGGKREKIRFYSKGKNHSDPLFSGVTVGLEGEFKLSDGAEFSLEFVLSAQPPSYTHAKIIYTTGAFPDLPEENTLYLPFPEKNSDGLYIFPLTKDTDERVGGLDNSTCYLDFVLFGGNGGAALHFESLRFMRELNYEPVRQEQIKLANRLGEKWGVTPFVVFEITGAGHHKNCYDTSVPCIDYKAHGFHVTQDEAIEHVKRHGGIFCYNHPFTEWKNAKLTEAEKLELIERLTNEFAENRVFGASLMEVGFPFEKEDFYDRHYLALWDGLSSRGIFITGDGDSDNHDATPDGWTEGNNFATWAGIRDGEPPSEESFRAAFVRGSVFCGDPTRVKKMHISANGEGTMGSIFTRDADIEFSCEVKGEATLLRIVNGIVDGKCEFKDSFRDSYTLKCEGETDFIRYEIRDKDGVLMALSNPVYTVKNEASVYEAAKVRIVK